MALSGPPPWCSTFSFGGLCATSSSQTPRTSFVGGGPRFAPTLPAHATTHLSLVLARIHTGSSPENPGHPYASSFSSGLRCKTDAGWRRASLDTVCPTSPLAPFATKKRRQCNTCWPVWHKILAWARSTADLPTKDTDFLTWWAASCAHAPAAA